MPLDDRDLREIALGIGDRLAAALRGLIDERFGDDLTRHEPDHARRASRPRDSEHLRPERADPHGVAHPVGHGRERDLVHRRSPLEHDLRHESRQVAEHQQVRLPARRDGAEVVETVVGRRVVRRHDECVLRRDAERDCVPHDRVDVTVLRDVLGLPVVGAERDPVRAVLLSQRQERVEVPRGRRLPDEQPHPGPQPLASLVDGRGFVVGADSGRRVGLKLAAEHAGRVTVDVRCERELRKLRRVAGDDAGKVHHLGKADHATAAQQRLEVPLAERAARRLEARRGDT